MSEDVVTDREVRAKQLLARRADLEYQIATLRQEAAVVDREYRIHVGSEERPPKPDGPSPSRPLGEPRGQQESSEPDPEPVRDEPDESDSDIPAEVQQVLDGGDDENATASQEQLNEFGELAEKLGSVTQITQKACEKYRVETLEKLTAEQIGQLVERMKRRLGYGVSG